MKRLSLPHLALILSLLGVLFFASFFVLLYTGIFAVPADPFFQRDGFVFLFALLFLTFWGITILYRLQDKNGWRIFLAILFLTQLWLYSGFLKRFVGWDNVADIALWRFSYLPMLVMPGLWLCLVLSDFTSWKTKKPLWILTSVGLFLFALIATNELHHWAFRPVYDSQGAIEKWNHGPLYFIVYAYAILLLFTGMVGVVVGTFRKRNKAADLYWVFVPLGFLVAYSLAYFFEVPWLRHTIILNNYYVMFGILGFSIIEVALRNGLTQNGGQYRQYFKEGPYRLALYDASFALYLRNDAFEMVPEIKDQEEVVKAGWRYRKRPFEGGYLILQEDIRDVLRLQQELLNKQKELRKTTHYLEQRKSLEAEIEKVALREKLNESVFSEIRLESGTIEKLVSALPDQLTAENRQEEIPLLEELQNRLSFLKQRCLFLLNASLSNTLSYEDFSLSQGSLNHDLANVGFLVAVSYPPFESIPLSVALQCNALLRSIQDAIPSKKGSVILSFDPTHGSFKARVTPEGGFEPTHLRFSPQVKEEDGDYFLSVEARE